MSKHRTLGLLASLLFVLSQPVAFTTLALPAAFASKLADSEVKVMEKISRFGEKPSLLCFDYLVAAYGPPNKVAEAYGKRLATWLDPQTNQPLFEFEQQFAGLAPGMAVRRLTLFGSSTGLCLSDLDSKFGTPTKKHYNEVGQPTNVYQLSTGTTLTASQPSCTFHVQKMFVAYKGVQLPLPSNDDFHQALVERRQIAFEHHDKGRHATAVPALLSYVRDYPNDAEAHIRLAESYKARACANRAIAEYSVALKLSGDNSSLRQMSIDGLKSLKVYPSSAPYFQSPPATPAASPNIANNGTPSDGVSNLSLRPPIGLAGTPASIASAGVSRGTGQSSQPPAVSYKRTADGSFAAFPGGAGNFKPSNADKRSVASSGGALDVGF
jgi:tetratricopeptide (TPR) repeat protein